MYYLYVDNSNVWIEGQRVAAVERGMTPNIRTAMNSNIVDTSWRIDFGRLHRFAAGDCPSSIARAVLYGTRPPPNDSLWATAEHYGFETRIFDRNAANQEKKVDVQIAVDIITDSMSMQPGVDTVILVAGDADYVPVAESLDRRGIKLEVFFWQHASAELKDQCSKFVSLDRDLDHLSLKG